MEFAPDRLGRKLSITKNLKTVIDIKASPILLEGGNEVIARKLNKPRCTVF